MLEVPTVSFTCRSMSALYGRKKTGSWVAILKKHSSSSVYVVSRIFTTGYKRAPPEKKHTHPPISPKQKHMKTQLYNYIKIETDSLIQTSQTWSVEPWVQSLVGALASCFSLPTYAAVLSTFWVWSKPSCQPLVFQVLKVPSGFRDSIVGFLANRHPLLCTTCASVRLHQFILFFSLSLRRRRCSCWKRPSGFAFRILVVNALCHCPALLLFYCLFGMAYGFCLSFFPSWTCKSLELQILCMNAPSVETANLWRLTVHFDFTFLMSFFFIH